MCCAQRRRIAQALTGQFCGSKESTDRGRVMETQLRPDKDSQEVTRTMPEITPEVSERPARERSKVVRGWILVVEDDPELRATLSECLRSEGYRVETAADGFRAFPKIEV